MYTIKATPHGIEVKVFDDFIESESKKLIAFEILDSIEELKLFIKSL